MSQAHGGIPVHFLRPPLCLGQAIVILDKHPWQLIKQIGGKHCPVGFRELESQGLDFSECDHVLAWYGAAVRSRRESS